MPGGVLGIGPERLGRARAPEVPGERVGGVPMEKLGKRVMCHLLAEKEILGGPPLIDGTPIRRGERGARQPENQIVRVASFRKALEAVDSVPLSRLGGSRTFSPAPPPVVLAPRLRQICDEEELRRRLASSPDEEVSEQKRELLDNVFELSHWLARQIILLRQDVIYPSIPRPLAENCAWSSAAARRLRGFAGARRGIPPAGPGPSSLRDFLPRQASPQDRPGLEAMGGRRDLGRMEGEPGPDQRGIPRRRACHGSLCPVHPAFWARRAGQRDRRDMGSRQMRTERTERKERKKISLARETVHRLDQDDLRRAAAGVTLGPGCNTYFCSSPKTCSYTSC